MMILGATDRKSNWTHLDCYQGPFLINLKYQFERTCSITVVYSLIVVSYRGLCSLTFFFLILLSNRSNSRLSSSLIGVTAVTTSVLWHREFLFLYTRLVMYYTECIVFENFNNAWWQGRNHITRTGSATFSLGLLGLSPVNRCPQEISGSLIRP